MKKPAQVKKKKSRDNFYLDIFRRLVWVEINNKPTINGLWNSDFEDLNSDKKVAFVRETKDSDLYVWFDSEKITHSAIAHESLHLATETMRLAGAPVVIKEGGEGEVVAYILTYCVEKITAIAKKHKIPIKD